MRLAALKQALDLAPSDNTIKNLTMEQEDKFTLNQAKKVVGRAWTTSRYVKHQGVYNYQPSCGHCLAVLLQKTKHPKTGKVVYKRFKNQTEAMINGKHKPSCPFIAAMHFLANE